MAKAKWVTIRSDAELHDEKGKVHDQEWYRQHLAKRKGGAKSDAFFDSKLPSILLIDQYLTFLDENVAAVLYLRYRLRRLDALIKKTEDYLEEIRKTQEK